MTQNIESRLAVCSWSLQPETSEALIANLREIGLYRVQLALDPLRDNPDAWEKTPELFAAAGIELIVVAVKIRMASSTSTIARIRM